MSFFSEDRQIIQLGVIPPVQDPHRMVVVIGVTCVTLQLLHFLNPFHHFTFSRDSTGGFERVGQKAATRMASSGGRGSATATGGLKRSNSVTVCQTPKDKEPPEADLEEDEEIERNLRIRGKLKKAFWFNESLPRTVAVE